MFPISIPNVYLIQLIHELSKIADRFSNQSYHDSIVKYQVFLSRITFLDLIPNWIKVSTCRLYISFIVTLRMNFSVIFSMNFTYLLLRQTQKEK